ncbi:MAG: c-type cytochrome [Motiliproteus sp.]
MDRAIAKVCAFGVTALLMTGCGEEAPKNVASVPAQESKLSIAEPEKVMPKSATETAKEAVAEAGSSIKDAAVTVAEKVEEQAVTVKERVTEVTANMVSTTAGKVSQLANAVETAVAPDKAAEKTYKGVCFACHDMGIAGAPKLGDPAAWSARIATGIEALYSTAINGKGAMPPKGGNAALTDAEVKAVVDYMVAKAK